MKQPPFERGVDAILWEGHSHAAVPTDNPLHLSRTPGAGTEIRWIARIDSTRKQLMFIGLSVLWCRIAVWGLTTVVVRQSQLRACRKQQAKSLALVLAELDRHRQLDKAA
jgi:hypothetical protein